MSTLNGILKKYNGESYDILHPQTNVGQVGETASVRFLKPVIHKVNLKSFYDNGDQAIMLYASDIPMSSENGAPSIASFLANFPTSSNMVTAEGNLVDGQIVLGNGSKGVHTTSSITLASLVAIAEGKTNTYTTHAYINDTKKYLVYGNDLLEEGTAIGSSYITGGTVGTDYIMSSDGKVLFAEIGSYSVRTNAYITANDTRSYKYLYLLYADDNVLRVKNCLDTKDIKIGDNLYIVQREIPDFWLYQITGDQTNGYRLFFSPLETQKVDLSSYATLSSLSNYLRKDSTETITGQLTLSGKVSYTNQNYFEINSGLEVKGHSSSGYYGHKKTYMFEDNFELLADGDSTYGSGLGRSVTTQYYWDKIVLTHADNGKTYTIKLPTKAQTIESNTTVELLASSSGAFLTNAYIGDFAGARNKLVITKSDGTTCVYERNKISVSGSAPSNPETGDIWFDTSA